MHKAQNRTVFTHSSRIQLCDIKSYLLYRTTWSATSRASASTPTSSPSSPQGASTSAWRTARCVPNECFPMLNVGSFPGCRLTACTVPPSLDPRIRGVWIRDAFVVTFGRARGFGRLTPPVSLLEEVWRVSFPFMSCHERGSNPGPPACEADAISFTPSPGSVSQCKILYVPKIYF